MREVARVVAGSYSGIMGEVVGTHGPPAHQRVTLATSVDIDIDVPIEDLEFL